MRYKRESQYGLTGLAVLAQRPPGTVMGLGEIAAAQGLPRVFLAKIFPKFVRHGLVKSFRGSVRGYALAQAPEEITVREILQAVEGPDLSERCLFGETLCDVTNPCLLHCHWREMRSAIGDFLEGITLKDVTDPGHIQTATFRRKVARPTRGRSSSSAGATALGAQER